MLGNALFSSFMFISCVFDTQGKLVVGHNMLLDVMHTVHQFYCSLPQVQQRCKLWEKFKQIIVVCVRFSNSSCPISRIFKTLKRLRCAFSQGTSTVCFLLPQQIPHEFVFSYMFFHLFSDF